MTKYPSVFLLGLKPWESRADQNGILIWRRTMKKILTNVMWQESLKEKQNLHVSEVVADDGDNENLQPRDAVVDDGGDDVDGD